MSQYFNKRGLISPVEMLALWHVEEDDYTILSTAMNDINDLAISMSFCSLRIRPHIFNEIRRLAGVE